MDEGLPIAYEVLEEGVPVYASGGELVGSVDHVVSAPAQDIFHGIVLLSDKVRRLVLAEDVAALHERGVDLRIDAAAVAALPAPHGAAPSWRVHEPGVKPSRWTHLLDRLSGAERGRGDWDKQG